MAQIQFYTDSETAQNSKIDYFLDEEISYNVVEGGVICYEPITGVHNSCFGGVYDSDGNFVAGHTREAKTKTRRVKEMPLPSKIAYCAETVVYGGFFFEQFGHYIIEFLARLWYVIQFKWGGKVVVLNSEQGTLFVDFFLMAGIERENIVVLKNATRFDAVIVPDQGWYLDCGYSDKFMLTMNTIRDSVTPGPYKKVYFSRRAIGDVVNEEYFERFYRNRGYEVICPEKLPIPEQIAIVAGAEQFVSVSGSICLHMAFCKENAESVMLYKTTYGKEGAVFFWVPQAKRIKHTQIDVSKNFLPSAVAVGSVYLVVPSVYWRGYIEEQMGEKAPNARLDSEMLEKYMGLWAKNLAYNRLASHANYSLTDAVALIYKHILNENLTKEQTERLNQTFPRRNEVRAERHAAKAVAAEKRMAERRAAKKALAKAVAAERRMAEKALAKAVAAEKRMAEKALAKAVAAEKRAAEKNSRQVLKRANARYESSLSWKITRPMRALGCLCRKLFKNGKP